MKWFLNISTRSKLLTAFSLMVLFAIVIISVAYYAVSSIHQAQTVMMDVEFPVTLEMVKLRNVFNRERAYMARMILTKDAEASKQWIRDINESAKEYDEKLERLSELTKYNPQYSPLIRELKDKSGEYRRMWESDIVPLVFAKKTREADTLFLSAHLDLYEGLREISINLSSMSEAKDKELKAKSEEIIRESMIIFAATGIAAVIAGIMLALLITNMIATPLKNAAAAAEKVAFGDLTASIPPADRKDEIGSLMMSMGMMMESLRMVSQEIKDTASALESSAGREEIASAAEKLKKLVEQYKI